VSSATRARRLTGDLAGAIAVVELRGSGARSALRALGVARPPGPGQLRRAVLRGSDGATIDDALIAAPDGERFELGLHGGGAVLAALRAALEALGVAWSNGTEVPRAAAFDGPERAAAELLAPRALLLLEAQRRGALRRELAAMAARAAGGGCLGVREELRALAQWSSIALPLLRPLAVALLGPPNAGKSSFFNAVIGRAENAVDARAGSTIDPVVRRLALGDLTIELWDTAGLDPSAGGLVARAVEESERRVRACDYVLWLSPHGRSEPPARWIGRIDRELATCADLGGATRGGAIEVSALRDPAACRALLMALLAERWPTPEGLGHPRGCAWNIALVDRLRRIASEENAEELCGLLATLVNDLGAVEHVASQETPIPAPPLCDPG
jgi:tRNA modification GTPase